MEYNLADLWERVADTVPDHEAMVCDGRRLTFAEEDPRATQLAHALAERGVGASDHVACYLYNWIEYLEVMLAAFKLHAVPINVNYRYVEEELRYLLDDSRRRRGGVRPEFAPKLATIVQDRCRSCTRTSSSTTAPTRPRAGLRAVDYESALAPRARARLPARSADDLYILYTGGTTGMPKGVMWRHEDMFFGAMGGAGGGGKPITAPEEIAERCLDRVPAAFRPARSCTAPRTG